MKITKKPLTLFFYVVLIIFSLLIRFKNRIFTITDVRKAEIEYSKSQYVLGENKEVILGDGTLYTYAGYRYINGEDPTKINFEHPPLGKYLIGLSYLVFKNDTIINLILYFFSFLIFKKIADKLIQNKTLKHISLFLFATMSIYADYATSPMLDIPLLFSTLLLFYSLFQIKDCKKDYLVGLSLGLYSSIKYPFPSLFLLIFITLIYYYKTKRLKKIFIPIFVLIFTYLLSYIIYFINNPNPIDFIKFEWYRFKWWTGDRTSPKFLIFKSLLFGKYQNWFDNEYIYNRNWSIFWPLIFIFFIISQLFNNKKFKINLINIFSILMFLAYAYGSASSGRYLMQVFPFWILVISSFFSNLFQNKNVENK